MTETNLYAPPKSVVKEVKDTHCRRDGKYVIVPAGSDLPERCVYCNAPAMTPVKGKKMYWHSPSVYFLILINIVLYAVVALIIRKTVELSPGLCEQHRRKRNMMLWISLSLTFASLLISTAALESGQTVTSILFFIVMLVGLVAATVTSRTAWPTRIDKTETRLKGCKEPFLASLEQAQDLIHR